MNSVTRPKTFKSRIPVLVTKVKSNPICEKSSLVVQNSNTKTGAKKVVKKFDSHAKKAPSEKTYKENVTVKKRASINPRLVREDVIASSKDNVQSAMKINLNSKHNKNKELFAKKIISEKENQETVKNNCFSAQNDIKFEANELFRKMILSERGLSPSACKSMPGFKLSSVQTERPSIYQKFELHPDPFKEAIEAITNASAKRGKRIASIQKDKKTSAILSPFKERNSFYTPCEDPQEEVMRSLKHFKERQMQKSSKKKVTFNLNVEEYTAKIDCDTAPISCKNSEGRLTQINEGSEENTPISPIRNTPSVQLNDKEQSSEASVQSKAANQNGNLDECLCSPISESSAEIRTPVSSIMPKDVEAKPIENIGLSFYSLKKTDKRHFGEILNSQKNATDQNVNRTRAKLYTPRPVSFYSNSRLVNNSPSPEFLIDRNSKALSNLAPIYTPLALKSIAKSSAISPDAGLSPVRLKLDFTVTEKDTPKKETSIKNPTSVTLEKILTAQKKLDDLADQECSFWLLNETIPVICGRYLQNPIAVTLTEGDEMHFVPIRL